jgi:hypothetical protein
MIDPAELPEGVASAEGIVIAMAPQSRSKSRHWPSALTDRAYHGLVGEFVRAVAEHTEADPAAILIQCLACVGNAVGRGPHFVVEDTRHGANLNVAIVGATSTARKGTSFDRAFRFVALADQEWGSLNNGEAGLSSAEGLIFAVRDASGQDRGMVDKRRLASMGELGEVLAKMDRQGNALGATLRNAWDGKTLRNMTKSNSLLATDAHISVIGHITEADLTERLNQADIFNGFANRFLWVLARRSQELPHGGSLRVDELPDLIAAAAGAITWAGKRPRRIEFDPAARKIWTATYHDLESEKGGRLDAITQRAAAQVRRVALIYAVLDQSNRIRPAHLRAAIEVWRYCEDSAAYLFADTPATSLERKIKRVLDKADGEWVTTTVLNNRLHSPGAYRTESALSALLGPAPLNGDL